MRKKYITPRMKTLFVDADKELLAGSIESSEEISGGDNDSNGTKEPEAKPNFYGSLWDD